LTIPREHFRQELQNLQESLVNMIKAAEKMLVMAIESLKERDVAKAKEVIALDDVVDDYNFKIEEKCLQLIALEQPVARDLRTIAAILKIITDVERIGDYSIDIAKFSIRLSDSPLLKVVTDVVKMAEIVVEMLEDTSTAFVRRDLGIVQRIIDRDEQVDALYRTVHEGVVTSIEANPQLARPGIWVLMIARYLERIGDHITNVTERIYYMETGEMIELHQ